MGDNKVDLPSPSKGFNDLANTSEEWIPRCDDEFKLVIGKVFDTLEEGGNFYKRYAHAAGFSVRNSPETKDKNGVKWKYFLCSKEGFKAEKKIVLPELMISENSLPNGRNRKLTREGCNARIIFKMTIEGKYEVARFYKAHTHALATPRKKQFLRSARNVNNVHKNLLFSYNRANVGTSKVYQLLKEQVGVSLNSNMDFNNRFKSCVWNSETSEEFELRWKIIISDFKLEENGWLSTMYDIRRMWIPTYFKYMFVAGILRTTSRSESENSLFGNYLNKNLSLVEFWMRFE